MTNKVENMHVVQVIRSLEIGGMEICLLNLMKYLRHHVNSQSVICMHSKGVLKPQIEKLGVRVIELDKRPGLDLQLAAKLCFILKDLKPSMIHCHNTLSTLYAGLAAWPLRLPLVSTRHGAGFDYTKSQWSGRLAARLSTFSVGVSQKVTDDVVKVHKIQPDKIGVIPNGIDSGEFAKDPRLRESMRAELKIASDESAIITVGRLAPEKDYVTLLRATAEMSGHGANIRVLFVGDGPLRKDLGKLCAELNLSDKVMFLGFRRDIQALLSASDVFCLSSVTEGTPISVIEAMAASLPVVSTDCGGMPELVNHGHNGYLVPVGDWRALAASLSELSQNPELSHKMGAQGRQLQIDSYSVESMASEYLSVYHRNLKRN